MTALINVDRDKCRKDGICADACPFGLISLKEYPEQVDGAYELCIACGHCVASCPAQALSNIKSPLERSTAVQKELLPDPDSLEHFLKSRRSVRVFKEKAVSRNLLERIIDCARWAPSAANRQPVRWIVVEKREEVRRLAEMTAEAIKKENLSYLQILLTAWDQGRDMILRSAPHLIIALGPEDNPWAQGDCAIALTYVELAAKANGLGTCWAGIFKRAAGVNPTIPMSLGAPEGHKIFGALMVGHPALSHHRIPIRNEAPIKWL